MVRWGYAERGYMAKPDPSIRSYLASIGRKGGKKSRRKLSADSAKLMVRVREAKKAYIQYFAQCFWSFDPKLKIGKDDVDWVAEQLMKNGNREAWEIGRRLCQ
jgi:hypothetical protein